MLRCVETKGVSHAMECPAGLTTVTLPVVTQDQMTATLIAGPIAWDKPTQRKPNAAVPVKKRSLTPAIPAEQFQGGIRLLAWFAEALGKHATQYRCGPHGNDPKAVVKAKEIVANELTEPLTTARIAERVGLSTQYFCKLFRKTTGMTFTEYVSQARVEKAKQLLLSPSMRVSEAAFAAGFQSIPHFNRTFRDLAGVNPSQYRINVTTNRN